MINRIMAITDSNTYAYLCAPMFVPIRDVERSRNPLHTKGWSPECLSHETEDWTGIGTALLVVSIALTSQLDKSRRFLASRTLSVSRQWLSGMGSGAYRQVGDSAPHALLHEQLSSIPYTGRLAPPKYRRITMRYLTEIIVAAITTGGAVAVAWIASRRPPQQQPPQDAGDGA